MLVDNDLDYFGSRGFPGRRSGQMSMRARRVLMVVCAFAVVSGLVYVAVAWPFGDGGRSAAASRPPSAGDASNTIGPAPGSRSTAVPNSPARLSLTCSGPPTFARGQDITITYVMDVTVAGTASLGAELYDSVGQDHAVGVADTSAIDLTVGPHSVSRQIAIPRILPADTYELNAEVWPANAVGVEMDNQDTLADASCGTTTLS